VIKEKNTVETIVDPPSIANVYLPIKVMDTAFLPEVRQSGIVTENANAVAEDMLVTLKNSVVNTIRIRLWKNPSNIHSSFAEVKAFVQQVKSAGMKVWLCIHYSDTWADPSHQQKPAQWSSINFPQLRDNVYQYTQKIVSDIKLDYIQIGNEINNGFLWPEGSSSNQTQFLDLIKQG
jgi:arabinogalactan endo-1,4-beta-galactosidase